MEKMCRHFILLICALSLSTAMLLYNDRLSIDEEILPLSLYQADAGVSHPPAERIILAYDLVKAVASDNLTGLDKGRLYFYDYATADDRMPKKVLPVYTNPQAAERGSTMKTGIGMTDRYESGYLATIEYASVKLNAYSYVNWKRPTRNKRICPDTGDHTEEMLIGVIK